MDETMFLGLFVGALVTVIPLFIATTTPIVKLNKSIQKLNDSIDYLTKEAMERDSTIAQLGSAVENHSKWLLTDKKRLDNHSRRLHKIDNEEGFTDNSERG